jgi:cell wall-associated NlpC family hydrolase
MILTFPKKTQVRLLLLIIAVFSLVVAEPFELSAAKKSAKTNKTSVTKSKKSSKTSGKKSKKSKKQKKSRRSYNPEKTRAQAQEIIRANSALVSELCGLDPLNPSLTFDGYSTDSILRMEGENIAELEMEDDIKVNIDFDDMDIFRSLALSQLSDGTYADITDGGIDYQAIMDNILDWLGTPYYFGGSTNRGIDCSAFVQTIFLRCANIILPRTARDQYCVGDKINRSELKFGDLVFFHTYSRSFASHVGIYLADNLFAHASSRYGVTVSSLESTYYKTRFIGGRRLSVDDIQRLAISKVTRAEH